MVETAVMLFGDRNMPIEMFADQVRAMEASGVIDHLEMADQLSNFMPPSLWTKENTPLAAMVPDPDSMPDAFAMGAYAMGIAPKLKLTISTDSIRRSPAELIQTMLTLQNMAHGNAHFHIGSGEAKQLLPYGHKRTGGLTRAEDLFKLVHAFFDSDGPIDFDGNHWNLRRAHLGCAKPAVRPQIWGLGGGPKLVDLATSHCDGLTAAAPNVWARPDQAAERISTIREQLEQKGRDPDKFGFGMWAMVLLHEDEEYLQRALDNPLVRWMAATYGRISPQDWRNEGIEPAVPEGWSYYAKLLPHDTPLGFVDDVVARSTHQMAGRTFFVGTPDQVADALRPYAEAGVSWICPIDYLSVLNPPEQGAETFQRTIDLCKALKALGSV